MAIVNISFLFKFYYEFLINGFRSEQLNKFRETHIYTDYVY